MKKRVQPSRAEGELLRRVASNSRDRRVQARGLGLALLAEGHRLAATARTIGVSRTTLYLWLAVFRQVGIAGLLRLRLH